LKPTVELLEGLNNPDVYFVPGNHEHWIDYDKLKEILLARYTI